MKRQFLCDMHSLMPAGFLMYLFMNDFFYLDVCLLFKKKMFYDWCECVMSLLSTRKHS